MVDMPCATGPYGARSDARGGSRQEAAGRDTEWWLPPSLPAALTPPVVEGTRVRLKRTRAQGGVRIGTRRATQMAGGTAVVCIDCGAPASFSCSLITCTGGAITFFDEVPLSHTVPNDTDHMAMALIRIAQNAERLFDRKRADVLGKDVSLLIPQPVPCVQP
jgi:hypothetical protein